MGAYNATHPLICYNTPLYKETHKTFKAGFDFGFKMRIKINRNFSDLILRNNMSLGAKNERRRAFFTVQLEFKVKIQVSVPIWP